MTPCSLVLRSAFCLNFRNVPSIFWLLWHSRAIEQCKCCSVLFCSVTRTTLALWQSRAIEQFKCCSVLFPEQHLLCGITVLLNSVSVVLLCSQNKRPHVHRVISTSYGAALSRMTFAPKFVTRAQLAHKAAERNSARHTYSKMISPQPYCPFWSNKTVQQCVPYGRIFGPVAAVFDWIKLVHYVTSDQVRKRASWCEGESICELNRGCGVCYGAAQSSAAGETSGCPCSCVGRDQRWPQ